MAELKLDAQPRTLTGRKVRQLRTQGLVPVVVYGNNQPAVNLQVSSRNLETTLHHGGFSQLVQVNVQGGGTHNVLVREIQRHPTSHAYLHVDHERKATYKRASRWHRQALGVDHGLYGAARD